MVRGLQSCGARPTGAMLARRYCEALCSCGAVGRALAVRCEALLVAGEVK